MKYPNANIGIATGSISDFIVVDVDVKNGAKGQESLASLRGMTPAPTVKTPSGGWHLCYRSPGHAIASRIGLLPGIDIKADGGYVVAASSSIDGKCYEWISPIPKIVPLPDVILSLMRPKSASSATAGQNAGADDTIPEGQRNDTLTRLAGKLRHDGLGEAAIFAALWAENERRCVPPLDEREVRAIAASIGKKPAGPGEKGGGPTVAQAIVKIGERAQLFHDERNAAYAAVSGEKGQNIMPVPGHGFKLWLSGTFYNETGQPAHVEGIRAALQILEAKAIHSGKKIPLWNRFARIDGEVWLDLADEAGRAVRVTSGGWAVIEKPPILFRRFSHQVSLPLPEKGGNLRDLLGFLNIAREEDKLLALAWSVVAMLADIPRPLLILHGAQGSAKTTAARMIRSLLDPSAIEGVGLRRDDGELAQVLDHTAVPLFDNLSGIGAAQADLLCQAVTGGGFTKRGLFTDDEDRLFSFKRAMLVTGITVPTSAPDLLERSLLIELERVAPEKRREESDLLCSFAAVRPRLLGGLLNVLAESMRVHSTLRLPRLPRMADFCTWGAAASEAMGFGSEAFVRAFERNAETQLDEVLSSSPIAAAIRELVEKEGSWEGSPSALYLKLRPEYPKQGDGWPKSASTLSKALRRLQTALADDGVRVTFLGAKDDKGHSSRCIRVEAVSARQKASLPSLASRPKEGSETPGRPPVFAAVSKSTEKRGSETAQTAETAKNGTLRHSETPGYAPDASIFGDLL
jgi:hypothetical protein